MPVQQGMALRLDQVGGDHFGAHFTRRYLRYPPQLALGLRRIAQQCLHFCWTKIARIDRNHYVSRLQSRRPVALHAFDDSLLIHALALESQRHTRSEEHTSELQSLMRISYAVFCLKKKTSIKKYIIILTE